MKRFFGILFTLALVSCAGNRYEVPGNPVQNISIQRFDKAFYEEKSLDSSFLLLYANQIMEVGEPGSKMFEQFETIYRKDKDIQKIYRDCQAQFNDVTDIEEELTWAFHRLHYFFPNIPIPKVFMHIAGFGESIVSAPGMVSASIDKYLGKDYNMYQGLFRPYQSQRMYREKLAADYVIGWVRSEFTEQSLIEKHQLLDYLLYEGRILFLTQILLPEEPMENLTGFSENQMTWCIQNERNMWDTMTQQQHLISNDPVVITKYIRESPFTPYFPQESPGRAAIWIGYRIVAAYMEKHPNVTVKDLMTRTKSQDLLKGSSFMLD